MITNTCLFSEDDIFRAGLLHFLQVNEFQIRGEFGNLNEVRKLRISSEFLLIADVQCGEDQAEAVASIKASHPSAHVIVLSQEFALDAMTQCFHQGASGYVLRSLKLPALIAALRLVALGEKVLPSNVAASLSASCVDTLPGIETSDAIAKASLTSRQCDVLSHLVEGSPNKIIARKLNMREATVKVHVKAILRKLHVRNRTQAALWASAQGLNGLAQAS